MKRNLYITATVLLMMHASVSLAGVAATSHNLSTSGPGTYKSATETEVCKFCHTPHAAVANTPLWGHANDKTGFTRFSSATLVIDADNTFLYQDDIAGASKLCMGCHDGVTALGALVKENIAIGPSDYLTATDLRNKHPVSFVYDGATVGAINAIKSANPYDLPDVNTNGTIINDFVAEKVRREGGRVECTICHDPHENRAAAAEQASLPFWVSSTVSGGGDSHDSVCKACHSDPAEVGFFDEYSSL